MRELARREIARSWPLIGIALLLWIGTVVLRTPELGINVPRVFAVTLTSGSMFVLGILYQRIKHENDKEDDQ